MDRYLINKTRVNMFNRILDRSEDIESAEVIMKFFFETMIPKIEQNINKPFDLFKHFQKNIKSQSLRQLLYQEVGLHYMDDSEPYNSFTNKDKLALFLDLIDEENLKLSDELGLVFDREELLFCLMQDINKELESIPDLQKKRDLLIKLKMENSMRLNHEAVTEIDKLLKNLDEQIENKTDYVDSSRIKNLQNISLSKFDTTKLIKLCEELNQAYRKKNYFTIPLLIRAIIDHVPPIFGKQKFNEVFAQHGTKSFKESMSHLDNSLRKVADSFIHTQIRKKEILPSHTQIDFRADLDVLLAEVCRILK